MDNSLTPEQTKEIAEILAKGNKIKAIELYRKYTGSGLKEGKDYIDNLVPALKKHAPEKFKDLPSKGTAGCAPIFLITIGISLSIGCLIKYFA